MQQNAGSNLLEKKLNLKKCVWASFNLIVISHASWSWIVFLCFIPWFSKGKVRLFLSKNAIYAKLLYEKIRKNIYWVAIIDDSRKMFVKNQKLPALLNHFPKKWKLPRILLSSIKINTNSEFSYFEQKLDKKGVGSVSVKWLINAGSTPYSNHIHTIFNHEQWTWQKQLVQGKKSGIKSLID